jgi:hypothetical protein
MIGTATVAASLIAGACSTSDSASSTVDTRGDAGIVDAGADRPTPPSPIPPEGLGCAGTKAAFCADFDQGPLEKGWDAPAPYLRRDVLRSTSAPASLLLVAPPADGVVASGWKLARGLKGTSGRAEVAFDIERNQFHDTAGFTCARLGLVISRTEGLSVDLKFHRDKVTVKAVRYAGGLPQTPLTGAFDAPDANRFQRVALSVDSRGAAPKARVSFDGIPALELALGLTFLGTVTDAALELGFVDEDTPFEWRLRIDDVTFDYR